MKVSERSDVVLIGHLSGVIIIGFDQLSVIKTLRILTRGDEKIQMALITDKKFHPSNKRMVKEMVKFST